MITTSPLSHSFLHKIFCVVLILCGLVIIKPAISATVTIDLSTLGIPDGTSINRNTFDGGVDDFMYEKDGFLFFGDDNNNGSPDNASLKYTAPGINGAQGGVWYEANNPFDNPDVRFIVKKADGQEFNFQSLTVTENTGENRSLFVQGYKDSFTVSAAYVVIPFAPNQPIDVNLPASFLDVDEVRFYSTGIFFFSTFYNGFGTEFLFDKFVFEVASAATPVITSGTYNASTGVLSVTAENITGGDTIDVNTLTLTGRNNGTYTLTSANVTASSATSFLVTLNDDDKLAINGLLNKNGTSSTNATTYNLAAAANWNSTVSAPEDLTGNEITVSNVAAPTITSAAYDSSTHTLTVTGTNFVSVLGANNDIDISLLTITGEGGSTHTFTSPDVEVTSQTAFSVTLNSTDYAIVETILNNDSTSSTSGTIYNLAAADDWNSDITDGNIEDVTNTITVSNVPLPVISSATYDAISGVFVISGTGFLQYAGATNDINVAKFTISGDSSSYTLTSSDVEITSGTSFSLTLNATDKSALISRLNKNGTISDGTTSYNFAAAEDWNRGAEPSAFIADLVGNPITVSNFANVPDAPTMVTASAGDTQAIITFSAPVNNGGAAITSYTVTSSPGGLTATGASSPLTVNGLTNTTPYTFIVTATNAIGTSSSSSASNSVTPKQSQTITFNNPGAQNFGTSPVLSASATSSLTPLFSSSTTGVCTVTSGGVLTFVTAGTCTIDANQAGNANYLAAPTVSQSFSVNGVVAGSPTIVSATAGDTQATVTFTPPGSNGGTAITAYTVTSNPGSFTATGGGSPLTVTGLTNGTAYTFSVTATNSAGVSSSSNVSNSVTPKQSQTITFNNPGAQNFNTSVTLSATADSGLTPTFSSTTTVVCTITSGGVLTFITTGTCTINANQAGNAAYAAAPEVTQSFTVNGVAADAPIIGTATAGDGEATISFSAPTNNGGVAITGYTMTSSPGGLTATGTGSPITVTGLTNGTAYTFSVTATNAIGASSSSSASNSVTPQGSQTITFNNPGAQNFGSSPVLSASATSSLTPVFTSSTPSVCTITSGGALTFITTGTCTINANQAGNAAYAAAPEVTQSFTVNGVAADAPIIGTATAGDGEVTISFSAPTNNGGVAITGYTVTSSPGGLTVTGTGSPITVTGLTNGTAYTFSVTATNAIGASSSSSASNSVTPKGTQTITFNNPGAQNFGSSPVLSASATSSLTPVFTSSTPSVCTITSGGALTFITTGTCTINANQAGNAAYAAAPEVTQSFTVNGVAADAPIIGTATAGDGEATISFSAPTNNGGVAITGYTVTSSPGGLTVTGTGSPITVTGLTNGTAYTFSVTATNAIGASSSSSASNSVTPKGTQTITFNNPGAQNFGTSPTLSATATSSLTPLFTSSTTGVCTVTSGGVLTFVTAGTCTISANESGNAFYTAAPEVTQSFTVNGVAADAPIIGTATAGDGEATISFSAPSNNGGAVITGYTVTSNPGGLTATGTGSPLTVTGLINGTAYTFSVTATNAIGASSSSSASNSVTPNGAPIISSSPILNTDQNANYVYTLTAVDSVGDTLTFTALKLPAWLSFNPVTAVVTGTPKRADVGEHVVELKVTDKAGLFAIQTYILVVNPVNSAPVANDASIILEEDTSSLISFTAVDEDDDPLQFEVVTEPSSGTLEHHGSLWLYTPDADFNGSDSITFIAKDAELSSDVGVISIEVTAINDEPIAVDDEFVREVSDNDYILSVLDNDIDVDGDTLLIEGAAAELGTVQIEGSLLKYQAPKGFVGPVSMRYSISDGQKGRSHAKVQLLITGSNSVDAPVITVPPEVIANATGLKTKLKIGVATAVDKDGKKLAVSLINTDQVFTPGKHFAYWQATDSYGLTSIKAQNVIVNPLVSINSPLMVSEGNEANVTVFLNGESPHYPLHIPYTVGGVADSNDHDLVAGEFVINSGLSANFVFNIFDDGIAETDEEITVSLAPTVNLSANNVAKLMITEANIAPKVSVVISQADEVRTIVNKQDGKVYIKAESLDVNPQDNLSEEWSLGAIVLETDDQGHYFDPLLLDSGSYPISLKVTDDGEPQLSTEVQMTLLLKDEFSALTSGDSDGDLIPDVQEGFVDLDGNGIPDYLDASNGCHVIQLDPPINRIAPVLAESEPGTCLGLGNTAMNHGNDGIGIPLDVVSDDDEVLFSKGLFDFNINNLPARGATVTIAIPQVLPIPINAVYRKFNQGKWTTFVENADNSVSSSAGQLGYCPPPGAADWQPGLTEGHWCVLLSIEDGGPNDGDGTVNGEIVDPGGVAVMRNNNLSPVAVADEVIVPMNQNADIDVLQNDIDADGDTLTIQQVSSQFGDVIVQDNQIMTYIPADEFIGTDTLLYSISDGKGGTAYTELTVTVVANREPIAVDDIASTDDKTVLILDVLSNDSDPDNQELSLIAVSAQQGSVMIQNNLLHYTPKTGFEGIDTLSYTISDGEGGEATANVMVTIKAYKAVVLDNQSGGGSLHWLSSCLLFLILILRKFKLKPDPRCVLQREHWVVTCSCVLALLLGSNLAQAKDSVSPWYLEANISINETDVTQRSLQQQVTAVDISGFDNSDVGIGVTVGYQVTSLLAFEIGYVDLGDGSAQISGETLNERQFQESLKTVSPVLAKGATIGARLTLIESQGWRFSLPFGGFFWKSDINSDLQGQRITTELDGTDFYTGMHFNYDFYPHWSMGLGINYYAISPNDILSYQLNLRNQF
ncbi:Ig-like domain-containing protein [Shewanella subflava]|uniref:Ig-like domain-containing protein n=1 Tax=Shewanella subflava TaxID=2986476 RepID=A0ABT3IBT2_9GAMM|nr:Ig-like domain-containing protein [Shewanella subflava]MCW3173515.1 Ig-like domain-containing protein [Shewanella subflava]